MKYCPECGSEILRKEKVCSECGNNLTQMIPLTPSDKSIPKPSITKLEAIGIILMLVIAILVIIFITSLSNLPEQSTKQSIELTVDSKGWLNQSTYFIDITMTNNQDHPINTQPDNFQVEVQNSYYRVCRGTGTIRVIMLGTHSTKSWRLLFDISQDEVPLKLKYTSIGEPQVEVTLI